MVWDPLHWCKKWSTCCYENHEQLRKDTSYRTMVRNALTHRGEFPEFGRSFGGLSYTWWHYYNIEELVHPSNLKPTDCGLCIVCLNNKKISVLINNQRVVIKDCIFPREKNAYMKWYTKMCLEYGVRINY